MASYLTSISRTQSASLVPAFAVKGRAVVLCCLLSVGVLSGCSGSEARLQREIDTLRSQLRDMRALQAEQGTALITVEERLRSVAGNFEPSAPPLPTLSTPRSEQDRGRSEFGINAGGQYEVPQDKIRRGPGYQAIPPEGAPGRVADNGRQTGGTASGAFPANLLQEDKEVAREMPYALGEDYLKGLQRLEQGRVSEASQILGRVSSQYTGVVGKAELLFWQAMIFDVQRNNRNAIASYNELVTQFPKHARSAPALSRIAAILIDLGDSTTAEITYQKLINDFPRSKEAREAKRIVKTLR